MGFISGTHEPVVITEFCFLSSGIAGSGALAFQEKGIRSHMWPCGRCGVVLILKYWQKYLSHSQRENSYEDKSLRIGPFLKFSLSGLSSNGEKQKK